jgi:hypothetical protein
MTADAIAKVFEALDLNTEEKRKAFHRLALTDGVVDNDRPVVFDGDGSKSEAGKTNHDAQLERHSR